jgi:hypothetical protein
MSEKGGLGGIWEDLNTHLVVDVDTHEDTSSGAELPLVTKFTVTNTSSKSVSTPEILFEEVTLKVGVPPELHVEKHNNLAGGESFSYEHRSRYGDLGKITYTIDGKVSPSHLLQVKRPESSIPHRVASLSISSYVNVLKDIDIRKWIKDPIEEMLVPSSDTTDAEIKAQQNRFNDAKKEINDARKQLENIYGFIIRQTDTEKHKVSAHKTLLDKYLTNISQACDELSEMLNTHNAKTINATRSQLVSKLMREAATIDEASQGLSE